VLLGSLAEDILHHAHCPVLITRQPDERADGRSRRLRAGSRAGSAYATSGHRLARSTSSGS
jgi:hypothetical protein